LDLVPLPSSASPIRCKWVYKIKTRSDGSIERYKARLGACGFQQEYGRDYEAFAPVARRITVHTLVAVASVRPWSISQLDVKNAFLHGEPREEVYMHPPPGYLVPDDHVCRLCHSLMASSRLLASGLSASPLLSLLLVLLPTNMTPLSLFTLISRLHPHSSLC
jgi:hypothetical protein